MVNLIYFNIAQHLVKFERIRIFTDRFGRMVFCPIHKETLSKYMIARWSDSHLGYCRRNWSYITADNPRRERGDIPSRRSIVDPLVHKWKRFQKSNDRTQLLHFVEVKSGPLLDQTGNHEWEFVSRYQTNRYYRTGEDGGGPLERFYEPCLVCVR
jgi:hypothetical protein